MRTTANIVNKRATLLLYPQISLPEKNNLRQSPDAIKLMAECWAEELLLVLLKLFSLYLYGEGEGI